MTKECGASHAGSFSQMQPCQTIFRPGTHSRNSWLFILITASLGQRFAAALLPRLFGTNPRSHHKGSTSRVRTGDQLLPVLCHCQLSRLLLYFLSLLFLHLSLPHIIFSLPIDNFSLHHPQIFSAYPILPELERVLYSAVT